jgi:hypothetical protein
MSSIKRNRTFFFFVFLAYLFVFLSGLGGYYNDIVQIVAYGSILYVLLLNLKTVFFVIFGPIFVLIFIKLLIQGNINIYEAVSLLFYFISGYLLLANYTKINEQYSSRKAGDTGFYFSFILVLFSFTFFVIPLYLFDNTTYYGLIDRGRYGSILDIGFFIFMVLISLPIRPSMFLLSGFIFLSYIPSRSLAGLWLYLAILKIKGFKMRLLIALLSIGFVGLFLLQNPYFFNKMLAILSGEEQRFETFRCGIDLLKNVTVESFLLGYEISDRSILFNLCGIDVERVEADILDIFLSFGAVIFIFWIFLTTAIFIRIPFLRPIILVGVLFGHLIFNSISLVFLFLLLYYPYSKLKE